MTEPKNPTLCEGVELTRGEVEEVVAMFQDAFADYIHKNGTEPEGNAGLFHPLLNGGHSG